MDRLQSRSDEIVDGHVLKTHFGCVLLSRPGGISFRPDATYL